MRGNVRVSQIRGIMHGPFSRQSFTDVELDDAS